MENFPGTNIKANGKDVINFLDGLFTLSDVNQTQLMEITGLSQSTIQNWVNRGWVQKSNKKGYDKDKVSRIFIINMLRGVLSLDNISTVLYYINGKTETTDDDIISESQLYIILCQIIADPNFDFSDFDNLIDLNLTTHPELSQNKERLKNGITIIIRAFMASKALDVVKQDMELIVKSNN